MKTYQELTQKDQAKAQEKALIEILQAITEGIRFDDQANGDNLQARIDAAGQEAEDMQTPWFWTSYIMDTCREDLESMASVNAEDSLYPDKGEHVIYL